MDGEEHGPMTQRESELAIKIAVSGAGAEIFKLVVDDTSILLSIDIKAEPPVRKATYAAFSPALMHSGVKDVLSWVDRITNRGLHVRR